MSQVCNPNAHDNEENFGIGGHGIPTIPSFSSGIEAPEYEQYYRQARIQRGAQGARAPLQWKKWGHTICPEPMSFFRGGGGWGGGGGYMVSEKGQNKDIKALYFQNQNISTYNILVRFHLHLSITFIFPIPIQQAIRYLESASGRSVEPH